MNRFSPSELRLLNLLPQDGTRINTVELTRRFYDGRRDIPEHARVAVGGLVRSLVSKTNRPKAKFKVMRSDRQGPRPIDVWLEISMPKPKPMPKPDPEAAGKVKRAGASNKAQAKRLDRDKVKARAKALMEIRGERVEA